MFIIWFIVGAISGFFIASLLWSGVRYDYESDIFILKKELMKYNNKKEN